MSGEMESVRTCASCGVDYSRPKGCAWSQWNTRSTCSKSCATRLRMRDAKLGPNTRYRATKVNGKRAAVHRIVAEAMLGRPLVPGEVVHHINHDRLDNRPENLVVLDEVTHQLEHHPPVHPVFKSCVICGREFRPHKTKRKRQQTCGSSACRSALIAVHRHGVAIADARARFAPEVAEALVRSNLTRASREEAAA